MNSIQRRHKRYKNFYIWKVIQGLVPNFGITWDSNTRRGRNIVLPIQKSTCPPKARELREQSLQVHGGNLFNCLPHDIRNFTGEKDIFKTKLDGFLNDIPDQPTENGLLPEPVSPITCKNSNSLVDWIKHLGLTDRRPDTESV